MKWLRIKVMLGCGFITITPDCLQAFVIESKDREMEAEKQAIKAYSRVMPSRNLRCIYWRIELTTTK